MLSVPYQTMAIKLEVSKRTALHQLLNTEETKQDLIDALQKNIPTLEECMDAIMKAEK